MSDDPLFDLHMTFTNLCADDVITCDEHNAFETVLEQDRLLGDYDPGL